MYRICTFGMIVMQQPKDGSFLEIGSHLRGTGSLGPEFPMVAYSASLVRRIDRLSLILVQCKC